MGDHYVYAIYNRTTGEYYLGKRSCRGSWADDGKYMGSGQKLRRKMKKHPDHVWEKEVLLLLDSTQEALEYERVLVGDRYRTDKRCLNLCTGGEGTVGYEHTDEAKDKISAAQKGRETTDEHRAKLSSALKGRTFTDEARAKMSAAHRGRTHSEETKAKRNAALRGRGRSDETRAKISAGRVRQTVDLVRAGVHYVVQVEDVEAELREGAEFKATSTWLHHPQAGVVVLPRSPNSKALLLLGAGWQWGGRSALRKVKLSDIDLATGLLR